jgi:hypothetical protein
MSERENICSGRGTDTSALTTRPPHRQLKQLFLKFIKDNNTYCNIAGKEQEHTLLEPRYSVVKDSETCSSTRRGMAYFAEAKAKTPPIRTCLRGIGVRTLYGAQAT